jgi:hypothetical protein
MKPSASTRAKTYAYLRDRFALDPAVPVFRLLRLLWDRDAAGQPLMAFLVAALRDPVLRSTVPAVLNHTVDEVVSTRELSRVINAAFPQKLSEKTLKSTGENTASTYKQSGHLRGRTDPVRQRVQPSPGSATMALLFATLDGRSGRGLFESEWVRLLDSPAELVLAEARVASGRGWLEYRHAGDVLEITFRQLFSTIGVSR